MFDCNFVFSTTRKLTVRPICNALYTCIYKFDCNFVFSTTNKLTVRPILQHVLTKFDCIHLSNLRQVSQDDCNFVFSKTNIVNS